MACIASLAYDPVVKCRLQFILLTHNFFEVLGLALQCSRKHHFFPEDVGTLGLVSSQFDFPRIPPLSPPFWKWLAFQIRTGPKKIGPALDRQPSTIRKIPMNDWI